ncbi:hypothetical protein Dsin_024372 [Dipteronia sinensis]|uniref:SWIM-type domain-containing protein n=1 Tax=Dipteronia sinensis TaxID=43782 RepID=A0AAD9ZUC1_9ROSI|nr:hypothetical protein Dsin_024372 [Dipteronia sinensis]
MFEDHGLDTIVFELDNGSVPNSPRVEQDEVPTEEAEVLAHEGGYQPLGWHDLEAEMLNYDGDSEKDDDKDDEEGENGEREREREGTQENYGQVPIVDDHVADGNQHSWEWFLNNLKIHLMYQASRNLTFMSDRQKGVIAALELYFPFAKRRYCARHIFANFRLTYKGEHYKKLFWRAMRSCNVFEFNEAMDEIGAINPAAKSWLQKIDIDHWSRFAYDPIIRCDHVTNNMTEAFNNMLGSYRAESYLDLLEFIRRMVMRKFQERKDECEAWNSILPLSVNVKIVKNGKEEYLWNDTFCEEDLKLVEHKVIDVGQNDSDHISLINLIRATIVELSGKEEVPNEDCLVWIHLPWRGERVEVDNDSELIGRYCARHIYANFRLTYKGDHFKKLFWRASRSSNVFDFKETMDQIGAINPAAKSWLQEIEPKHWSRYAYDHVIRCDHVTNNMTEAFNSMLGTYRASSYLDLLEFIRRMVMRKFQERKKECDQWNSFLPPRVNAKILKNGKQSRVLTIVAAGNMEYELLGPNEGYVVKLSEYSCQCGSWQVSGIPCRHAMAVISHYCGKAAVKDKVSEYVHQSLTKSAYIQTYTGMIHPIPNQNRWPEVPACTLIEGQTEHIDPPSSTVQPGRPKIQRKREPDEGPKGRKSGTVICKLCSQVGHNQRTWKSKKNKTNETSTTTSSSHQPIQQQSTFEGSSSQPPPTQTETQRDLD